MVSTSLPQLSSFHGDYGHAEGRIDWQTDGQTNGISNDVYRNNYAVWNKKNLMTNVAV